MKLLLILLIALKAEISAAQKSTALQGKCRVFAICQVISSSSDSLYYDLDKDSMYIPSEDLREASKDGLDSIQTVDLFKSMYGSFKNATFAFEKDSVILQYKTGKAIGTYQVKSNDTLYMHLFFEEKGQQEQLIYFFSLTGDLINIWKEEDMGHTRFVLKRE
jgi:hypothetical protein